MLKDKEIQGMIKRLVKHDWIFAYTTPLNRVNLVPK